MKNPKSWNWIALYGAVLATGSFVWQLYTYVSDGPRLDVDINPAYEKVDSLREMRVFVINSGRRAATLYAVELFANADTESAGRGNPGVLESVLADAPGMPLRIEGGGAQLLKFTIFRRPVPGTKRMWWTVRVRSSAGDQSFVRVQDVE